MWVFGNFFSRRIVSTILDNLHGKFISPFPQNHTGENGAFWRSRGFILDLEGLGFAVPFHSVQDCSFKPRGIVLGIFGGSVPPGSPILALFQTKKCNFPHPFSDQTSKFHTHFQTWPLGRN